MEPAKKLIPGRGWLAWLGPFYGLELTRLWRDCGRWMIEPPRISWTIFIPVLKPKTQHLLCAQLSSGWCIRKASTICLTIGLHSSYIQVLKALSFTFTRCSCPFVHQPGRPRRPAQSPKHHQNPQNMTSWQAREFACLGNLL